MIAFLEQYGLTRTKLAVIAVLTSVMAGVWGNALLGGESSSARRPSKNAAAKPAVKTATTETTTAAASADGVPRPKLPLPVADADQVAGHDPFARPRWAVDESVALRRPTQSLSDREEVLQELRETGVTMVMVSGGKKVATVGDKRIRPGDTIEGFRVLDVTAKGVVLSERPVDDEF